MKIEIDDGESVIVVDVEQKQPFQYTYHAIIEGEDVLEGTFYVNRAYSALELSERILTFIRWELS